MYQKALDAIMKMFEDTSYTVEECKENLQGLRDEIENLLETLPEE